MVIKRLKSYVAYVKACRVIDGDTVELQLDLGWGFEWTTTGRIYGVDVPELHTAAGMAVKRLVEKLVENAMKSETGDFVQWYSIDVERPKNANDKFGRTLGTLRLPTIGGLRDTLTAFLIRHELAREYRGDKKRPWPAELLGQIQTKAEELIQKV